MQAAPLKKRLPQIRIHHAHTIGSPAVLEAHETEEEVDEASVKSSWGPSPVRSSSFLSVYVFLFFCVFRVLFPCLACATFFFSLVLAYRVRLLPTEKYGYLILEYDPWAQYRAARYLEKYGWNAFLHWFDTESWYPLGRPMGTTTYPGLPLASVGCLRVWEYLVAALRPLSSSLAYTSIGAPLWEWMGQTWLAQLVRMLWLSPIESLTSIVFTAFPYPSPLGVEVEVSVCEAYQLPCMPYVPSSSSSSSLRPPSWQARHDGWIWPASISEVLPSFRPPPLSSASFPSKAWTAEKDAPWRTTSSSSASFTPLSSSSPASRTGQPLYYVPFTPSSRTGSASSLRNTGWWSPSLDRVCVLLPVWGGVLSTAVVALLSWELSRRTIARYSASYRHVKDRDESAAFSSYGSRSFLETWERKGDTSEKKKTSTTITLKEAAAKGRGEVDRVSVESFPRRRYQKDMKVDSVRMELTRQKLAGNHGIHSCGNARPEGEGVPFAIASSHVFHNHWIGLSSTTSAALVGAATSAFLYCILPAHLMRSMAGSFDNESLAVPLLLLTFWSWLRAMEEPPWKAKASPRGQTREGGGSGKAEVKKKEDNNRRWKEGSSWMSVDVSSFPSGGDSITRWHTRRPVGVWGWGIFAGILHAALIATWGGFVFSLNLFACHAALSAWMEWWEWRYTLHTPPPSRYYAYVYTAYDEVELISDGRRGAPSFSSVPCGGYYCRHRWWPAYTGCYGMGTMLALLVVAPVYDPMTPFQSLDQYSAFLVWCGLLGWRGWWWWWRHSYKENEEDRETVAHASSSSLGSGHHLPSGAETNFIESTPGQGWEEGTDARKCTFEMRNMWKKGVGGVVLVLLFGLLMLKAVKSGWWGSFLLYPFHHLAMRVITMLFHGSTRSGRRLGLALYQAWMPWFHDTVWKKYGFGETMVEKEKLKWNEDEGKAQSSTSLPWKDSQGRGWMFTGDPLVDSIMEDRPAMWHHFDVYIGKWICVGCGIGALALLWECWIKEWWNQKRRTREIKRRRNPLPRNTEEPTCSDAKRTSGTKRRSGNTREKESMMHTGQGNWCMGLSIPSRVISDSTCSSSSFSVVSSPLPLPSSSWHVLMLLYAGTIFFFTKQMGRLLPLAAPVACMLCGHVMGVGIVWHLDTQVTQLCNRWVARMSLPRPPSTWCHRRTTIRACVISSSRWAVFFLFLVGGALAVWFTSWIVPLVSVFFLLVGIGSLFFFFRMKIEEKVSCGRGTTKRPECPPTKPTAGPSLDSSSLFFLVFSFLLAVLFLCCSFPSSAAFFFYGKGIPKLLQSFVLKNSITGMELALPVLVEGAFYGDPGEVEGPAGGGGRPILLKDRVEAFLWLRTHTPTNARVLSWWEHGFHLNALANRTSFIDGNTWSTPHIATVARLLLAPAEEAHSLLRHVADYIFLLAGEERNDVLKAVHMSRIANTVYPDLCGRRDPLCDGFFNFTSASSLPHYHLFHSLLVQLYAEDLDFPGIPPLPSHLFQEVFQSSHGMVRIFKVMGVNESSRTWIEAHRRCEREEEVEPLASSSRATMMPSTTSTNREIETSELASGEQNDTFTASRSRGSTSGLFSEQSSRRETEQKKPKKLLKHKRSSRDYMRWRKKRGDEGWVCAGTYPLTPEWIALLQQRDDFPDGEDFKTDKR